MKIPSVALYNNINELVFSFSQKEILHFLRDAVGEPITEPTGISIDKGRVMEIILENEEKCSEKMKRDPPYNKSGTESIRKSFQQFSFLSMLSM